MKTEEVKEKYQIELKWASYYFISSLIISFIYAFFQILFFNQTELTSVILLFLNIFTFLYFSYKCIEEKKHEKVYNFISKLAITSNVFIINFSLFSLLITDVNFIIPKREIEIQMITENLPDNNSNLLKDFIAFLKIKSKQ